MPRSLPIVFTLTTVVIGTMGMGLILPVMPDLVPEVTGGDLASAALWGGVLSASLAVMLFVFGPVVGNLSNRLGRRPVLLIAVFLTARGYLVTALAGAMRFLLVGWVVGGRPAATQSTGAAPSADTATPVEMSGTFGLILAAGLLIGRPLGELGPHAPFYAAALAALTMVFGILVLPETVTDRIRRPFERRRANPVEGTRLPWGGCPGWGV